MKDRIVRAAEECFVEYGIKGTTMERIAEKMHVSKRTLYEFFPDKASLLTDCLKERMESSLKALRAEIAASGSLESILRINDSVFAFFELPWQPPEENSPDRSLSGKYLWKSIVSRWLNS